MPAKKKDFTTADTAIDKLFTTSKKEEKGSFQHVNTDKITNTDKHAKHTHNTQYTNKRGKRAERLGLLLDEQLKEDLTLLSKAINSRSVNDLIVTALVEYVEQEKNQVRLKQYRKLLQK